MRIVHGFVACFLVTSSMFWGAGCGPACDHANLCAVEGKAGDDTAVCDGDGFVSCDDSHRGDVIFCGDQPRKAVCGSAGWSFEYAPLAQ